MLARMTGFRRIFRSRWAALFWSAGILWTAYSMVPDEPSPQNNTATDAPGDTVTNADLDAIASGLINRTAR